MPLTAAQVLTDLRASPLDFFRHYKLTIAGGGRGGNSGLATFQFLDQQMTSTGFTTGISGLKGKTKNRAQIRFTKLDGVAAAAPDINVGQFNAYYVAMHADGAAIPGSHFALPTNGPTSDANPDLMLTSQLSNCTFGVGSRAAGAQLVSHIEPNVGGGFDRAHLHASVTVGMVNGVSKIYERENQNNTTGYGDVNHRATIIGVRGGTHWKFYAQAYKNLSAGGDLLEAKKL